MARVKDPQSSSSNTDHSHMANIVPDISLLLVTASQGQGPLERGQSHVVLLGVEAAQAQVVVQLAVVHPHLQ